MQMISYEKITPLFFFGEESVYLIDIRQLKNRKQMDVYAFLFEGKIEPGDMSS